MLKVSLIADTQILTILARPSKPRYIIFSLISLRLFWDTEGNVWRSGRRADDSSGSDSHTRGPQVYFVGRGL